MLRKNSRLRTRLDESGIRFLEYSSGAIERILPHVKVSGWKESTWSAAGSWWDSPRRRAIRVRLAIGNEDDNGRSLEAFITRRSVSGSGIGTNATLDDREYDICKMIAKRVSEALSRKQSGKSDASMRAIQGAFDEYVVATHVQSYHGLAQMPINEVFDALHKLSEESYENKALTFGCILDPQEAVKEQNTQFPGEFLTSKKYKALSDGFRTAYHIARNGKLLDFVDLKQFEKKVLTEKHHYPDWAEMIARASRNGRCGIALSRQGEILIFDGGTLRFTYRYGRWQYWNHAYLLHLLRDRARAQHIRKKVLGRVVGAIYRAALDVSFRRSGGLFVVLHNRKQLRKVVRRGDAIADAERSAVESEFDEVIGKHTIQSLRRVVTVELASLDGAVVLNNSGRIRAYGAVLNPRRAGRHRGSEGSRTKAAIGASKYGLALKVSSDGDITVYYNGAEFIRM
jgi:hypothetical protein